VVAGIALVGFTGENSFMAHRRYVSRINELQEEIDILTRQFQHDQSLLRKLQTDPKMVEKVARERYFMRRSGEDVFVMEDEL
jgi:cell division protein FtsB